MLTSMKTLLDVANRENFAVPAFNISHYAMLNGLVEIAQQLRAPVILEVHPDELNHVGPEFILAMREKAHNASVPVAIHLDHGANYEQILAAIRCGFTSVMIDGSTLPYDENAALCKRVAEAAHAVGLSVEGELGTIGSTGAGAEAGADEIIYTDPDAAERFVAMTGVDCLAIAIGTSHGLYPKGKMPELRLDILSAIKAKVHIPLVLHGGSNNRDEEITRAVELGVNKINISSDIKAAYYEAMRGVLGDPGLREPMFIEPECVLAMKAVAKQKIELFHADGKADLYAHVR